MFRMSPNFFVTLRNISMDLRHAKMDSSLLDTYFSRCHSDSNVYTKKVGTHIIICVLYLNDFIDIDSDPILLIHVKSILKKKFEMTELGHLHHY